MDLSNSLRMMLAAVVEKPNDSDFESFDYLTAANILRMQKICSGITRKTIDGHTMTIVTRDAARKARDAYTRTYLLSLDIPYEGIQMLASELCRKLKSFNVAPSDAMLDFASGKFDWKSEYESLLNVNSM